MRVTYIFNIYIMHIYLPYLYLLCLYVSIALYSYDSIYASMLLYLRDLKSMKQQGFNRDTTSTSLRKIILPHPESFQHFSISDQDVLNIFSEDLSFYVCIACVRMWLKYISKYIYSYMSVYKTMWVCVCLCKYACVYVCVSSNVWVHIRGIFS